MSARLSHAAMVVAISTLLFISAATGAHAATISGLVSDDYFGTPLSGVNVTLVSASGDGSTLATTTTSADGRYAFSGVAPSTYCLYYFDTTGSHWPQWYDGWDTFDLADEVDVSVAESAAADVSLDAFHVKAQSRFTTVTMTPLGGEAPLLGDTVSVDTTVTDVLWGTASPGLRVVVQSSPNGISWSTLGSAADDGDGTYHYEFTPTTVAVRYFRFYIAEATDAVATASTSVRFTPRQWPMTWEGASFADSSTALFSHAIGQEVGFGARLFDENLNPVVGGSIAVQGSADGKVWTTVAAARVSTATAGLYEASASVGMWTFYRLYYAGAGYREPKGSAPVFIKAPWKLVMSAPQKAKPNRWVYLQGTVNPRMPVRGRVTIAVQKKSRGRWIGHRRLSVAASDRPYGGLLFTRVRLPRGDYRWRASLPADAYRYASATPYRPIRVR
jgi:hypothetical protein